MYPHHARSRQLEALAAVGRGQYDAAQRLADELIASGDNYGRIVLARLYIDGLGVRQDLSAALKLLEEAESLWSLEATYQKAAVFAHRKDPVAYFSSVRKAASGGLLPAKCALGRCYLWGLGVTQNVSLGEKILGEAAALGNVKATYLLAYHRAQHPKSPFNFLSQVLRMLWFAARVRYVEWVDPTSDRLE